jgi:hypothetical protein
MRASRRLHLKKWGKESRIRSLLRRAPISPIDRKSETDGAAAIKALKKMAKTAGGK